MKKYFCIVLLILSSLSCFAQDSSNYYVTKGNYIFAYTESDLDKATRICTQKDTAALQQMIDQQRIFIVKQGLRVYVVKKKFSTVLVRFQGMTLELWTVNEAIQ
jgi:hypothetical protein